VAGRPPYCTTLDTQDKFVATNSLWYAGRCAKRQEHDAAVMIEVVSRQEACGWRLIENAQKIFPKAGEVELRASDSKSLRQNEWVAFQLAPSKGKRWSASVYRKLPRFADLSQLGSVDEVHRVLAIKGFPTIDQGGPWLIRVSESEVIKVDVRRSGDVTLLSPANVKVSAYKFDPACVIEMPNGSDCTILYDTGRNPSPIATYDWSPDVAYASRVVRSLSLATDPHIADVIASLEKHAEEASGRLTANSADLVAAHEALRSGELAKRLAEDRQQLQAYVQALQADPKIMSLIKTETATIAEKERGQIHAKLQKRLEQEVQSMRRSCAMAVEEEVQALGEQKRAELDAALATRLKEIAAKLDAQRKEDEAKLNRELGSRKVLLEEQITSFTKQRNALQDEVESLTATAAGLTAQVATLREQEGAAAAELDRLLAAAKAVPQPRAEISHKAMVPLRHPTERKIVPIQMVRKAIDACPLLSTSGKALMEQLVALTLAGEVPVLVGREVGDFLWIAESLFSNGSSARLEADPTLITYEDVWVRAGIGAPTPIAQALEMAQGENPFGTLAVIERAERSGARFWFPALADRARRGDLPRHFLLCVTLEDESCEEAKALLSDAVRLEVNHAFVSGAAAIAVAMLGLSPHSELDPGERPTNMSRGMQAATSVAQKLGIAKAIRAARAATEMASLAPDPEAQALASALAGLFAQSANPEKL
jgi:hypothetical protein